jgi:hypothetical protein
MTTAEGCERTHLGTAALVLLILIVHNRRKLAPQPKEAMNDFRSAMTYPGVVVGGPLPERYGKSVEARVY